jgi:hypothetical protein
MIDSKVQVISQWKLSDKPIKELKIKSNSFLFAATDYSFEQIPLFQCNKLPSCSLCTTDPYCGWNIREMKCESYKSTLSTAASPLITLNPSICEHFNSKNKPNDNKIKVIQLDSGSNLHLKCNLDDETVEYLNDNIEWHFESTKIDFNSMNNVFLTQKRDMIILAGNSSRNGVYSCFVNQIDLVESYRITFKPGTSLVPPSPTTTSNQKCITAEKYIRQYNNWCDEFSRYQRALNDWEDLKDKSCSSISSSSGRT